jgi:hypothetical protein
VTRAMELPEIHSTHDPEPDDAPRLYASGIACRRCCWFVAFDDTAASGARITKRGEDPCPGPTRISLRGGA